MTILKQTVVTLAAFYVLGAGIEARSSPQRTIVRVDLFGK